MIVWWIDLYVIPYLFPCMVVSYEARAAGVKRSMRGNEACQACPELVLVQVPVAYGKADIGIYRDAGDRVVQVLSKRYK